MNAKIKTEKRKTTMLNIVPSDVVGVCPECLGCDGCITIDRNDFGVCNQCNTYWWFGCGFGIDVGRDHSDTEAKRNKLDSMREVDPIELAGAAGTALFTEHGPVQCAIAIDPQVSTDPERIIHSIESAARDLVSTVRALQKNGKLNELSNGPVADLQAHDRDQLQAEAMQAETMSGTCPF